MKKLAYIILVIAILLLIAHFVKNDQTVAQEPSSQAETTSEVSMAVSSNEQSAPSEDSDVVEVQETSEDIIIEEGAPEDDDAMDVEETSEATMDEEETVLPE